MTGAEVLAGLLAGVRRCAFCGRPATVRGRTVGSRGLPACDADRAKLVEARDLPWAGAVRAALEAAEVKS